MPQTATDTVRRFYETVFQSGDIDTVKHFMAEDFVDHAPWPDQPPTRAGFEAGTLQMLAPGERQSFGISIEVSLGEAARSLAKSG